MPIKLNDPAKLVSKRFKRKDVKDMVQEYRNEHFSPSDLKFTHFTVKEILELFIDNGIIDKNRTLVDQMNVLDTKGVKMYLGKHFKPETCQEMPHYLTFSNIIICNTDIVDAKKRHFKDMLDDTKHHSFMLAGVNEGLDMGHICPPDCADPDGAEYDVAL